MRLRYVWPVAAIVCQLADTGKCVNDDALPTVQDAMFVITNAHGIDKTKEYYGIKDSYELTISTFLPMGVLTEKILEDYYTIATLSLLLGEGPTYKFFKKDLPDDRKGAPPSCIEYFKVADELELEKGYLPYWCVKHSLERAFGEAKYFESDAALGPISGKFADAMKFWTLLYDDYTRPWEKNQNAHALSLMVDFL